MGPIVRQSGHHCGSTAPRASSPLATCPTTRPWRLQRCSAGQRQATKPISSVLSPCRLVGLHRQRQSAPRARMAATIVFWQPIASMHTSSPRRRRPRAAAGYTYRPIRARNCRRWRPRRSMRTPDRPPSAGTPVRDAWGRECGTAAQRCRKRPHRCPETENVATAVRVPGPIRISRRWRRNRRAWLRWPRPASCARHVGSRRLGAAGLQCRSGTPRGFAAVSLHLAGPKRRLAKAHKVPRGH